MSMIAASGEGSVQAFASRALPRVLRALVGGARPVTVFQRLGAALERSLALPAVELAVQTDFGEGVVYQADQGTAASGSETTLKSASGNLVLRVAFHDAEHSVWLRPVIQVALETTALARAHVARPVPMAEDPGPVLPEPWTLDPAIEAIYDQARRIAEGDIGVLIRGESGCGKEVLANFIHRASRRPGETFLALNCAALPHDLLEAELFGVERGVATGVEARPGLFERAHDGTLFLDEVGDMALDTQARILRVMQEGEVTRLGGTRSRPARARILAATNRDLEGMIDAGTFRRDLYHRLTDWQVTLPALAARRVDIVNLAVYFLDRELARIGLRCGGLRRETLAILTEHSWPGNIRQLERQMVRAALFLEDGEPLGREHLGSLTTLGPTGAVEETLESHLERIEKRAIEKVLAACGGDVERAATRLEVGRSTLYRRVKHLGIAVGE